MRLLAERAVYQDLMEKRSFVITSVFPEIQVTLDRFHVPREDTSETEETVILPVVLPVVVVPVQD